MAKYTYLLWILIIVSFFSACTYEYPEPTLEPEITDTTDVIGEQTDSVSFSDDVFPIISQNCLSCHNGFQPPNLSSYEGVKANAASVKNTTSSRSMPVGGSLSEDEIRIIALWVEQGAGDN